MSPNCTLVELKTELVSTLQAPAYSKLYLSGIEIQNLTNRSVYQVYSKLYLSGIEIGCLIGSSGYHYVAPNCTLVELK